MSDVYSHDDTGSEIDSVFEEVAAAEVAITPSQAMAGETDAGLDQVREILLGQQTRQLEQRLTASEQRVERSVGEMHAETTRRVDAMESSIKGELTTLIEMLSTQREERTAQYQALQAEIERVATETESKIAELSERFATVEETTRDELTRQVNTMSEELETRVLELSNEISAETASLRGDLIDRDSMASLLSELSLKLSARPIDAGPASIDAGDETEAMLGELLGGEGP